MAAKKTPTLVPASEGTLMDFIYCGERCVSSGGTGHAIMWLADPPEDSLFKMGRRARMVIGGIYTGARKTATGSVGLDTAKYSGLQWRDKELITLWEARDSAAKLDDRMEKLEADRAKQTSIEKTLAPLREMYTNLSDRGDWAGMKSLEIAVSNALRKRTKPANKGEFK